MLSFPLCSSTAPPHAALAPPCSPPPPRCYRTPRRTSVSSTPMLPPLGCAIHPRHRRLSVFPHVRRLNLGLPWLRLSPPRCPPRAAAPYSHATAKLCSLGTPVLHPTEPLCLTGVCAPPPCDRARAPLLHGARAVSTSLPMLPSVGALLFFLLCTCKSHAMTHSSLSHARARPSCEAPPHRPSPVLTGTCVKSSTARQATVAWPQHTPTPRRARRLPAPA